ncbi:MAG: M48 family metallopeptidase [Gemmatimonadaceae bacterium]|nr:M48 family metallopeptidase [Gemmatimonadaceae bacterium]
MTVSPLPQIASTAWEHPADRAALNTLRSLPGFDEIIRKIAGFFGERGLRHLFLANAVRTGPTQHPRLHAMVREVCETLDVREVPDLYVTLTPFVNAGAIGFDRPFIVINTGSLAALSEDEQRFVLAHEVGHIASGHMTYRTIAVIVSNIGFSALPFLAGLALMPFQLALLEWSRKAELSCDRAALLAVQDPTLAMRSFFILAGGSTQPGEGDLDAFLKQAAEYESEGSAWDSLLKAINTALREHPFNTVRAAELQRWIASGAYARILSGEYPRRDGTGPQTTYTDDVRGAADYYGQQAREAFEKVGDSFSRAADAFRRKSGG